MRVNLLVIEREDSFLPKGHICGILPVHERFSEYERNCGLWKVVEGVDAINMAAQQAAAEKAKQSRGDKTAGLRSFEHADRGGLDRSHSTVWDYGPGRTFSQPRSAFSALVSQVGRAAFTETHYIRGWVGTYYAGAPGGPYMAEVLELHTVSPTPQYRLVIDRNAEDEVVLDGLDQQSCINGQRTIGEPVHYASVEGLVLKNADYGITPATWDDTFNWRIKSCLIENVQEYAIRLNSAQCMRIENCIIRLPSGTSALKFDPGFSGSNLYSVSLIGSEVCATGNNCHGLWLDTNWCSPYILIAGNSFYMPGATSSVIYHSATAENLNLQILQNNIFSVPAGSIIKSERSKSHFQHFGPTNYNCWNGSKILSMTDLELTTLSDWQAYVNDDAGSITADPLFTDPANHDLSLNPKSPCRAKGAGLDPCGLEGNLRGSPYFDIGAYNPSIRHGRVGPRLGHIISRRIR